MKPSFTLFTAMITCVASYGDAAPPLSVSVEPDGATVRVGDEVFCRYLKRSGTRPVLWPVVGPTGAAVTRSYPVAARGESEATDHIHHRSMWIGYEGVNGVDFWHEPETHVTRPLPIGTVRHREFVRADSDGGVATVGTRNDWLAPDGRAVCHDQRLYEFSAAEDRRIIDCTLDLWSSSGPLVLGDTKEGFFAVRVAGAMKVDARRGGRILNSDGAADADAWGRPARWVDYSGPVRGGEAGVAILAHAGDHNPSPRWHVRPYGLFAANPFGVGPYLTNEPPAEGGFRAGENEKVRLRYRVVLHDGSLDAATLDALAEQFAESKR